MSNSKTAVAKKTIALFFGGCSTEYEVSLQSACSVIQNIDSEKYHLILIGIDRDSGKWFWYQGSAEAISRDCWQTKETCTPVFPSVDRTVHGICYLEGTELRTVSLDGALPVLHGKNGEDGTLQGMLELMGVPVIGCGMLSSALCMDKELAHQIVRMDGIRAARSAVIGYFGKSPEKRAEGADGIEQESLPADRFWQSDGAGYFGRLAGKQEICRKAREIGYPLFVKPVRSGSSFGITKVQCEEQLVPAVMEAFRHDSTVILEEMIDGFEVGCAILGTEELIVGAVDEIELSDGFFDYTEKYTLKTSLIHVPARITQKKAKEIQETALRIYRMLRCTGFARVDMFLTPKGEIYFNEVNTIPGFTSHSRYPNMLKETGMAFGEVVERLLM